MRNRVKREKNKKIKQISAIAWSIHIIYYIFITETLYTSPFARAHRFRVGLSLSLCLCESLNIYVSCSISFLVWWILSDDKIFSVRIRKMDLKKKLPSYQTHEAKIPIDTNSKQIRYVYQKKWSALNVSCPNGTIYFMSIFIVKSANNNKIIANNWI